MAWYWIVLISLYGIGMPYGVYNVIQARDKVFYHHPILNGFDILAWLFIFLLQLASVMIGWPLTFLLEKDPNHTKW